MTSTEHVVFGLHAVQAVLSTQPERCLALLTTGSKSTRRDQIEALAATHGIEVRHSADAFDNPELRDVNHQGVLLHTRPPRQYQESDITGIAQKPNNTGLVLALDSVQDPHNLGACLRSAGALGVDMVLAPRDRACDITPTVRKVASGAAEIVPFIRVTNLVRTLKELQQSGSWVYGADGSVNATVSNMDFTAPCVLVMGAEGQGLRQLTRKTCDALFAIPMGGNLESLNVAVATGICLYEAQRQRSAT